MKLQSISLLAPVSSNGYFLAPISIGSTLLDDSSHVVPRGVSATGMHAVEGTLQREAEEMEMMKFKPTFVE